MKFLSRKKFKLVIFGLLVIAVVSFLALLPNKADYKVNEVLSVGDNINSNAKEKMLNAIIKKDTDGDGLKDWEEELWGTDKNNPDTDGDGKNDGDEVNAGESPIVVGSGVANNDASEIQKKKNDFDTKDAKLTTTDKFAQAFFQEYLYLKQSGASLDEMSKEFLISSAADNFFALNENNSEYLMKDIVIAPYENTQTIKEYGNAIAKTVQKYSKPNNKDDLDIFEKALRYEDPMLLAELKDSIFMYESLANDFISIPAPKAIAPIHLDIANGYKNIADSLKKMILAFDDPLLSLSGINDYMTALEKQVSLSVPMRDYFFNNGIVFASYEAGAVWNMF
jgi:hypothetical protein